MTQQDIIYELNRLVIGYNLNWDMVKLDADRAIMKINTHLGAEYPMMSAVMISPNHRYTITCDNKEIPIFPERYILTVVIPYIASEVLARDEEFTTIYNKYIMDFENGLFDMFQNEFNKVPLQFRQDPDVGVFFSTDIKEHAIRKEHDKQLPEFKFNIYYHFNFEGYDDLPKFTIDTNKYEYGKSITVLDSSTQSFIRDIYSYEFEGWSTTPDGDVKYVKDDVIENVTSDIHLFAVWDPVCVLANDNGTVTIKSDYASKLVTLHIPPYVDKQLVKTIPAGFTTNASKLEMLVLPRNNITLQSEAINNTALRTLILPPYDYLRDTPNNCVISHYAFTSHSLTYLYIPYSVSIIGSNAITGVSSIRCEHESKPSNWSANWTDCEDVKWGIANG